MIEQEFIMLIMNCQKYQKKAKFQKMTWLPHIPSYLRYYHVIGNPELDTKYKFDNENCVLWVKVADDYNSLPKKVMASYEAIYETFYFKYLFFSGYTLFLTFVTEVKVVDYRKTLLKVACTKRATSGLGASTKHAKMIIFVILKVQHQNANICV